MSIKDLFEKNKEKMIEKIDSNSFKYFKKLISMKEKYDYILSDNPEVSLNYTLLKNANDILCSFEEDNKVFIENFFLIKKYIFYIEILEAVLQPKMN